MNRHSHDNVSPPPLQPGRPWLKPLLLAAACVAPAALPAPALAALVQLDFSGRYDLRYLDPAASAAARIAAGSTAQVRLLIDTQAADVTADSTYGYYPDAIREATLTRTLTNGSTVSSAFTGFGNHLDVALDNTYPGQPTDFIRAMNQGFMGWSFELLLGSPVSAGWLATDGMLASAAAWRDAYATAATRELSLQYTEFVAVGCCSITSQGMLRGLSLVVTDVTPAATVPLPGTLALSLAGLAAAGLTFNRRRAG